MNLSKSEDTRTRDEVIQEIARRHLFLTTLETRKSDSLDFNEHAVWQVRAALEAAFEAGRRNATQS